MAVAVVAGDDEPVGVLHLHVVNQVEPCGHLGAVERSLFDAADGTHLRAGLLPLPDDGCLIGSVAEEITLEDDSGSSALGH